MSFRLKFFLIILAALVIVGVAAVLIIASRPTPFSFLTRSFISLKNPAYCRAHPELKDPWGRDPNFDINKLPTAAAVFKLNSVIERPGMRSDLKLTEQREFTVYLARPDLKLNQEDCVSEQGDIYTSDLPAALQPKRMSFSDITDTARDSGNNCDTAGFPHGCVMNLAATDQPVEVLVKVAFRDDTYAEQKLTIPFGGKLDKPVLLAPKAAPKEGDKFALQFKDVGADDYEIRVSICHPYRNDGINPCLKGWNINLMWQAGKIILVDSDSGSSGLKVTNENSAVILQSDRTFSYAPEDDSVNYSIQASKEGRTEDGIKTRVESNYSVSYPR